CRATSRRTKLNSAEETSRGRGSSIMISLSMGPGPALMTMTRSASSTAPSTECDENSGYALAQPEVQKFALQLFAGERVECARTAHLSTECWRRRPARGRWRRAASSRRKAGLGRVGKTLEPDNLHEFVGDGFPYRLQGCSGASSSTHRRLVHGVTDA